MGKTLKLFIFLVALIAFSIDVDAADVYGAVRNSEKEEPLVNAQIEIYDGNEGTMVATNSDNDGFFILKNVPEGEFILNFKYNELLVSSIPLTIGTEDLELKLFELSLEDIDVVIRKEYVDCGFRTDEVDADEYCRTTYKKIREERLGYSNLHIIYSCNVNNRCDAEFTCEQNYIDCNEGDFLIKGGDSDGCECQIKDSNGIEIASCSLNSCIPIEDGESSSGPSQIVQQTKTTSSQTTLTYESPNQINSCKDNNDCPKSYTCNTLSGKCISPNSYQDKKCRIPVDYETLHGSEISENPLRNLEFFKKDPNHRVKFDNQIYTNECKNGQITIPFCENDQLKRVTIPDTEGTCNVLSLEQQGNPKFTISELLNLATCGRGLFSFNEKDYYLDDYLGNPDIEFEEVGINNNGEQLYEIPINQQEPSCIPCNQGAAGKIATGSQPCCATSSFTMDVVEVSSSLNVNVQELEEFLLEELNSNEALESFKDLEQGSQIELDIVFNTPNEIARIAGAVSLAAYDPKSDKLHILGGLFTDNLKFLLASATVHETQHKLDLGPESKMIDNFPLSKQIIEDEKKGLRPKMTEANFRERMQIETRAWETAINFLEKRLENSQSSREAGKLRESLEIEREQYEGLKILFQSHLEKLQSGQSLLQEDLNQVQFLVLQEDTEERLSV